MKKFNILAFFALSLLAAFSTNAQSVRFLNPVFSGVTINRLAYGANFTILAVPSTGRTLKQPLGMDVYQPTGDTAAKRPLVIYLHTGNFLPNPQNGSPSGKFDDSTAVEISTQLAKMGYVVASADYRLGWDPLNSIPERRNNTLINAAYRGVQDARTCVRFFKENAAAFKIDTNRIVMWGQGTGGYIALAAATLNKYTEIVTTTNPAGKFVGSNGLPMVIEKVQVAPGVFLFINSDIEGKNNGFVPPNADGTPNPGPPPTGDTLCKGNWLNHNSDFQMYVNLGGALGDISWLDSMSTPGISFHCPYDPYAPYKDDILYVPVPPTPLPVVRVQGSYEVQKKAHALGLDANFTKIKPAFDPYGAKANSKNEGFFGLFPIYGSARDSNGMIIITDASPWDFWSPANVNNPGGLNTNPNMSKAKALIYIDTIIRFYAPRACKQLKLASCADLVSGTEDVLKEADVKVTLSPNPAYGSVQVVSEENSPIRHIVIYDVEGRIVDSQFNINANSYEIQRKQIPAGMYFVEMHFEKGKLSKKLIFN